MLPRPSFVLTDLIVEEDPAYGAEPVLHANTVTASIWLLPLWRGRLEINRISVDEASLNLVHTPAGQWNLDSFLRTPATRPDSSRAARSIPFPYMEATNSRINIKNGVEKLPFSIVNADLSFWQDDPGVWRVRLRGQPARTDVSLDLPDMGILRLEGNLRRASADQPIAVHADLDWQEAQLGQLSRLLLGSDEGWRGDLTGELHIDGTAVAAQVTSRLRASGVHRAEFAPASPLDFDATCNLLYRYSGRGIENLLCDSPIGDGRVRLTGAVPGGDATPHLTLEMDRVPAQVGLDALRTVRNGLDPSFGVSGAISGQITYAPVPAAIAPPQSARQPKAAPRTQAAKPQGPLTGSLTVTSLRLTSDGLSKPLQIPKITIDPAPGEPAALTSSVPLLAGAPVPLTITARLSLAGYQLSVRGNAALPRLREMSHAAGFPGVSALDSIDGQPASIDMSAGGPWLPSIVPVTQPAAASTETPAVPASPLFVLRTADHITGTLTLHDSIWKSGFLANPVQVATATLHLENGARWDPIAFTYGPVKGTATLEVPLECESADPCPPKFSLHFGTLDAAELQAAILGARQSGTLISSLIARLRPSAPAWPHLEGTVRADTLVLNPVTLTDATATLRILTTGAEIAGFDAALLGGRIHADGSITSAGKPAYKLKGEFTRLDAPQVGQLLGMTWSGSWLDGTGELELSGFTDKDLATSAKGTLHFDWRKGSVTSVADLEPPPALAKFDRWTADAEIANGAITLKQNQVFHGPRKQSVSGSAAFGNPPTITFTPAPESSTALR